MAMKGEAVRASASLRARSSFDDSALAFQAQLLAAAGQPIVACDNHRTVIYWNAAAERAFGWTEAEAVGQPISMVMPPAPGWDQRAVVVRPRTRDGEPWSGEFWIRTKCDDVVPLMVTTTPILDVDGAMIGTIGVSVDISERIRAEQASVLLSAIVESSSDPIFSADRRGAITTWNSAAAQLYGRTAAEMIGCHVSTLMPVDQTNTMVRMLRDVMRGIVVRDLLVVGRRGDGSAVDVTITVSPVRDISGRIVGSSTIAREVSERIRFLREIEADHRRLEDAQASAGLGSFEIDFETGRVDRSAELLRILGQPPDATFGLEFERIHPDDRERVQRLLEATRVSGEPAECTHRIVRPSGEIRWVVSRTSSFRESGARGLSGTMLDITDRHQAELALAHEASHDSLTGLANRAAAERFLSASLADRGSLRVAVVVIDIDRFKLINDRVGRAIGDRTLHLLAERLKPGLRPTDFVGRSGGDDFVLIRAGVDTLDDGEQLAAEAASLARDPFRVDGHELQLTVSIGVVVSEPADTATSLLRDAEDAMYEAKADGGATTVVFDDASRSRARRRQALAEALPQALELGQLHVEYQPVLDLTTLQVAGFEALLRWRHPVLGAIAPDDFIPAAETTGLIVPISDWVLAQALGELQRWRTDPRTRADLWMAVNISAHQLKEPDLVQRIMATVDLTGVPAGSVHLEITESATMDRIGSALATLSDLRSRGVRISIDDFGTGHSSLSYLSRLPIDVIKIDRSFVGRLLGRANDTSIVKAIVAMATTLRLDVIAEGVETAQQLAILRDLGCGEGQGFLWSPSMPPPAALQWMIDNDAQR